MFSSSALQFIPEHNFPLILIFIVISRLHIISHISLLFLLQFNTTSYDSLPLHPPWFFTCPQITDTQSGRHRRRYHERARGTVFHWHRHTTDRSYVSACDSSPFPPWQSSDWAFGYSVSPSGSAGEAEEKVENIFNSF